MDAKWEYKIVGYKEPDLNTMGADGWEAVGVVQGLLWASGDNTLRPQGSTVLMKRPIAGKAPKVFRPQGPRNLAGEGE